MLKALLKLNVVFYYDKNTSIFCKCFLWFTKLQIVLNDGQGAYKFLFPIAQK